MRGAGKMLLVKWQTPLAEIDGVVLYMVKVPHIPGDFYHGAAGNNPSFQRLAAVACPLTKEPAGIAGRSYPAG